MTRPLTPADFRPIVVPPLPSPVPTTGAAASSEAVDAIEKIQDFATQAAIPAPRPTPRDRALARSVRTVARAQPGVRLTGHSATGAATWYCRTGVSACHHAYPGGLYAAAGPALRVGNWRGRHVRVCGNGNCVNVTLIDWCACGGNHIIDLYSDAFRYLAPLSAGAVRVKVSW